jgi:hypothetical protein
VSAWHCFFKVLETRIKKMKTVLIGILFSLMLFSNESDWNGENNGNSAEQTEKEDLNPLFEKAKIKNRSNRVYKDKVYKYITGDQRVKNNTIELATVHLNDNLQNEDTIVNMYAENLDVEGNPYKDGLDIRHNRYKNFVNNDENNLDTFDPLVDSNDEIDSAYDNGIDEKDEVLTSVSRENSRYTKVEDEDVSEIEEIDLRDMKNIKEVNVLVEDMRILVD